MDRNDVRSNLRIRLFQIWKEQQSKPDFSYSLENWSTVWDKETLYIYRNELLMAKINQNETYLSEVIDKVYDFPLSIIKQSIV